MDRSPFWRWLTGLVVAVLVAATPAPALVRWNDGLDTIHITGTAAYGYDSNIFASNGGAGDSSANYTLALEYQRRAGYIGINAGLGWDFGRYNKFTAENFANPHMNLELTKEIGRTTGTLQLNAARQSSTDAAANMRTDSTSYGANLNWKYPYFLNERYTLSGALGYSLLDFNGSTTLVNLATLTANVDFFYVYSTDRDLFGGYRLRISDTSANTQSVDHNFSLGVSGKIIPKLSGDLRVGWQVRQTSNAGSFSSFTAASTTRWEVNRKTKIVGQLSKDFSTTSTDVTTDSLTAGLEAQYAYNAKWSAFANTGYGLSRFLGLAGGGRVDSDWSWGLGASYAQSDHFKATLAYSFFENWSNIARSNYTRNTLTLTLTSRW